MTLLTHSIDRAPTFGDFDFSTPLPQSLLNIEDKNRSNLFAWRGQFSPQLVASLLQAYSRPGAVVVDPFAGSGTVLHEAACLSFPAFGFEINPSAWAFAKVYEFVNVPTPQREAVISELRGKVEAAFPLVLFSDAEVAAEEIERRVTVIGEAICDPAKILCNALVVMLDIYNNRVTNDFVHGRLASLVELVRRLPYSEVPVKADLQDARALPLGNQSTDFVITSPPYINVFNYHQNYRKSAEVLGWDLLRVARSEIGSNRANRGNRFLTVIQYCIDMAGALQEMARILRPSGKAILVVGHESMVLGSRFFNAQIVEDLAVQIGMFDVSLRQQRVFANRFGAAIREDVLNLRRASYSTDPTTATTTGRNVARSALLAALEGVSPPNRDLLSGAIGRVEETSGTPIFNSQKYSDYHTRDTVMVVRDKGSVNMSKSSNDKSVTLPTPHLAKLNALANNKRVPSEDRPCVTKALKRYHEWIEELEGVKAGQKGVVQRLVDATNRYWMYVELDFIFCSPGDFLYRQKGQTKLDNTILEEFLPQLLFRGLSLADGSFELGPSRTFAGLSFTSSIANTGTGGRPALRTKNQDFVLGKCLYIQTSFDKDFTDAEKLESQLGYVCAECKTNLDKTMFQEAVATSRDLKIAVPSSLYFLVCEFLDMTPVSITPTNIDDVLIVRKCKRMSSNIRQEYSSAKERRRHEREYREFLESARFRADVFQRMIDKIQLVADASDPEVDAVLRTGHF